VLCTSAANARNRNTAGDVPRADYRHAAEHERVGMMHGGITHQKLFVVRVGIHARQHDSNAATREHPQSVSLLLARPNQIAELFVEREF